MQNAESKTQKEVMQKLTAFVVERIRAGDDKVTISNKLVEMGMSSSDAAYLVDTVHAQVMKAALEEQFTFAAIFPALLGAVVAAVVGGIIWGLIVILTNYEIGFVAWGIGALAGYAVVKFARGRKGLPLQIIAVAASLLGILIGKYLFVYNIIREQVTTEFGAEAASTLSVFSPEIIRFFFENISLVLSGFDILFVILAVITAWRIPKSLGIPAPKEAITP